MSKRKKVMKALECCTTALGCKTCPYSEKGKGTDDCQLQSTKDALELLKRASKFKEPPMWGGFIDVDWKTDLNDGYRIIAEKLAELGLLKLDRNIGILTTRYTWCIKAVKWDDKG